MTWTADKPTAAGYYWHRCGDWPGDTIVRLFDTRRGFRIDWIGTDADKFLDAYSPPGSQWSGPILPPTEEPT